MNNQDPMTPQLDIINIRVSSYALSIRQRRDTVPPNLMIRVRSHRTGALLVRI